GHSSAAIWFDFDLDGYLDLYVTNVGAFTVPEPSPDAPYARRGINLPLSYIMGHPEADHGGAANILYRNNGDGTFTDVTKQARFRWVGWNGDATVADYDLDGYPDLYVSQMFGANHLFHNNGNGTFSDVTRKTLGRTSWGAMGALFFDANNDGRPDLYVVDMHSDMWTHANPVGTVEPSIKYDTPKGKMAEGWKVVTKPEQTRGKWVLFGNTFFVNRQDGSFEECSEVAGLENFWPWGAAAGDFDNDGWQDLFIPTGMGYPFAYWPNSLMMNTCNIQFADLSKESGIDRSARRIHIEDLRIRRVQCS